MRKKHVNYVEKVIQKISKQQDMPGTQEKSQKTQAVKKQE